MTINRDARLAILNGFQRRDLKSWEIWEEFAEREGYASPGSILKRIEDDFGSEASLAVQDELIAEVGSYAGRMPSASPPLVAALVKETVKDVPEKVVPPVLPDELFAALIEAAWDLLSHRHLDGFSQVGGVYEPPDPEWLNRILSKHRAPCQLVEGRIEWTDPDLAGESPATDIPSDWGELRTELRAIREDFRRAARPDDYNAVGARCDRALRTLGRLAFDAGRDLAPGDAEPSKDHCRARLTLYFKSRASGKRNSAVRQLAEPLIEAAYDQAQMVKHGRNVDRAAAGVAISSLSNLVDLIAAVRADDATATG